MISLWFSLLLFMLPIVWVAYCYDTKTSSNKIAMQMFGAILFAFAVAVIHVIKWLSE